jgi:hypothetical protein
LDQQINSIISHSSNKSLLLQEIQQLQLTFLIQKRIQDKSSIDFTFRSELKEKIGKWKSIKIICESSQTLDSKLAIIGSKSNTISIHPNVCSFGKECFQTFLMKSIEISFSITSLSDCCFQYCSSLTQISLPNSITFI